MIKNGAGAPFFNGEIMDYFEKYVSNTLAGSGNQTFFYNKSQTPTVSRTFYKVFAGGEYPYSFLISNTVDSTFSDGSHSRKNRVIDSWVIEEMSVGVSPSCDAASFTGPEGMMPVTFSGARRRTVNPGELLASDPVTLNAPEGAYLCVEIVFSGGLIPYHEESIIPSFVLDGGEWKPSKLHPFLSMVGAARPVKKRVAFLGDSITQGIGTPVNSYAHWNAVFAERAGRDFAFWNLGLGYGRADDAASDGAWLFKARQNDVVFVCFGVNDINRGFSAAQIKANLQYITDKLNESGVSVVMQTVPPFDYPDGRRETWEEVNRFIMADLKNAACVFDCVPILGRSGEPHKAKYGGHPGADGCRLWGEKLCDFARGRSGL